MFLEIDVSESDNCPISLARMFDTMEEVVQVSAVMASDREGADCMCDVTGWSSTTGPCPAYAVRVEDSGEGVLTLVYGGDEGIRLKRSDCLEPWDLRSPRQWGEACLLLDQNIRLDHST